MHHKHIGLDKGRRLQGDCSHGARFRSEHSPCDWSGATASWAPERFARCQSFVPTKVRWRKFTHCCILCHSFIIECFWLFRLFASHMTCDHSPKTCGSTSTSMGPTRTIFIRIALKLHSMKSRFLRLERHSCPIHCYQWEWKLPRITQKFSRSNHVK